MSELKPIVVNLEFPALPALDPAAFPHGFATPVNGFQPKPVITERLESLGLRLPKLESFRPQPPSLGTLTQPTTPMDVETAGDRRLGTILARIENSEGVGNKTSTLQINIDSIWRWLSQ